ncbi:MAG: hypothetical protein V1844_09960 [Pseudomonadota bacterium]
MTDDLIEIIEEMGSDIIEIIDQPPESIIEINETADPIIEIIEDSAESIVEITEDSSLNIVEIVDETVENIIEITDAGITPGPKGEPGAAGGILIEYPARESLSGHRIVVLNEDQDAIYADHSIMVHANKILGMTTGASVAGAAVTIQTGGELTEPSWDWELDIPVWLSSNGLLSQTPPTTGFSLIVGFPISSTKLFISIHEPIYLV